MTTVGLLLLALSAAVDMKILVLVVAQVGIGFGGATYNINQLTLRQAVTPLHVLGRVNASRRFLVFGLIPVGAVVGGTLAQRFGASMALLTASGVMAVSVLWLVSSKVQRFVTLPAEPRER